MASNTNPSLWASFKLSLKNADFDSVMKLFLNQLSQFANQILQQLTLLSSASGLAAVLNGSKSLLAAAFVSEIVDLGTITTDQTVPVAGAAFVFVRLTSTTTQTRTITLSNLPQGATVMIDSVVSGGQTLTLKLAATDTSGNAYTISGILTTTGALFNFVSSGIAQAGASLPELFSFGMSGFAGTTATPRLNLLSS
jgi:hypothetical protein